MDLVSPRSVLPVLTKTSLDSPSAKTAPLELTAGLPACRQLALLALMDTCASESQCMLSPTTISQEDSVMPVALADWVSRLNALEASTPLSRDWLTAFLALPAIIATTPRVHPSLSSVPPSTSALLDQLSLPLAELEPTPSPS